MCNDPTEMENAPDMSAGSRKILTSAEAEAGELLVNFEGVDRCCRGGSDAFRIYAYGYSTF